MAATCVAYCIEQLHVDVLSSSKRDPEKFMLQLAALIKFQSKETVKMEYDYLCSQIPPDAR